MPSRPFETNNLAGMPLPNRFVRSATCEGLATLEGESTPALAELMAELARGGVGLIITGHAYVLADGRCSARQMGAHRDGLITGLREMAAAVHEAGGKIVMQIAHGGAYSLAPDSVDQPARPRPAGLAHCSDIWPADWSVAELHALIEAFARAASRAKEAGFDGVQVHAAHGYLLNQFLSPALNHRTDEYGGSLQNRARFPVEVLRAVRESVGPDYPILVKINSRDFLEGGLSLDESIETCGLLTDVGLDAIEVSGGLRLSGELGPIRQGPFAKDQEAYFEEECRRFSCRLPLPLILVGGVRSFSVAARLLEDDIADYISMSRPFIAEPNLINRWAAGDRRRAICVSGNFCSLGRRPHPGLHCAVESCARVAAKRSSRSGHSPRSETGG
jgi:2,4-dienoyl-CoA reductase-like NADH-dependent reductase (Old Yellow Enzyme family)